MATSMFAGVSGLRNNQTRMDVIGNNIANVNTIGFKSSRVNFQELFNQTLQGASSASGNRGGTNPIQIGLGMTVSSVDTIFTDGSVQPTGKMTDMSIQGNGFFIISDGAQKFYTRAGNFDFDVAGNFVLPGSGLKVQGWMADEMGNINTSSGITNISLSSGGGTTMPPKATTEVKYANNLDQGAIVGNAFQTSLNVYDKQGKDYQLDTNFTKVQDNVWSWVASGPDGLRNNTGIITFNPNTGKYSNAVNATSLLPTTGSKLSTNIADLGKSYNFASTNVSDSLGVSHAVTTEFRMASKNATSGETTYYYSSSTPGFDISNKAGVMVLDSTGAVKTNMTRTLGPTTKLSIEGNVNSNAGATSAAIPFTISDDKGRLHSFDMTINNTTGAWSIAKPAWEAGSLSITGGSSGTLVFDAQHRVAAGGSATMTFQDTDPVTGDTYTFSANLDLSPLTNNDTGAATPHTSWANPTDTGGTTNYSTVWPMSLSTGGANPAYAVFTPNFDTVASSAVAASTAGGISAEGGSSLGNMTFRPVGATESINIMPSFSSLTQYASQSTIQANYQDGYAAGSLDKVSIDSSGIVMGRFTNNLSRPLAQVALATFDNPGGLMRSGDNMFIATQNSGLAAVGTSGTGSRGKITPGTLEMSNVDIAQEFTNMIMTQRGFQANSKIITSTDEMMQTLENLKR